MVIAFTMFFMHPVSLGISLGAALGGFAWRYYPTAKGAPAAPLTVCLQAVYLALCLTPVFLNIRADRTWSRLDARNEVKPCIK